MLDVRPAPPALVRGLAEELARFQARGPMPDGRHHLGIGWFGLCPGYPSPGRACSPRCAAITRLLEEAAIYLRCDISAFRARARRAPRTTDKESDG